MLVFENDEWKEEGDAFHIPDTKEEDEEIEDQQELDVVKVTTPMDITDVTEVSQLQH
jgi:hypothetical protein